MMIAKPQVQVVVIDDSVRFAFHVWRYLSRNIGIGSEDESIAKNFWTDSRTPKPMETADGEAAVWWVNGNSEWNNSLRLVLDSMASGPRLFLVDMRGKPPRSRKEETTTRLQDDTIRRLGKAVLSWLMGAPATSGDSVMMVSSYETGTVSPDLGPLKSKPVRIEPKSPDTLAKLKLKVKELLDSDTAASAKGNGASTNGEPRKLIHILVTGAGFEVSHDAVGTFGLPPTPVLLENMEIPFRHIDARDYDIDGETGVPQRVEAACSELAPGECGILKRTLKQNDENELPRFVMRGEAGQIVVGAASKNLDLWWNSLIEMKLQATASSFEPRLRSREKMAASTREREMREAFRRVILKYDWGYMNQSLLAAKMRWHSWLTTNYTRFADRAIALSYPEPWQIISTSIEALSLSRQILHEGNEPDGSPNSPRYLFKLHGDIAHLQTMATAGQDKEFFSSLSVPVDSLHQVYSAAETCLGRYIQRLREYRVVWHIVGHGLNDRLLLQLIAEVCVQARPRSTDFIIVSSRNPRDTRETLREFLGEGDNRHLRAFRSRVREHRATAEQYMARIEATGGLPDTGDDNWISNWLDSLSVR